jgi:hypothetical protein
MVPMRTSHQPRRQQPHPGKGRRGSSASQAEQPVRPARVRQASVTSAMLTPAERARLRAIAAVNSASARPRAGPPRAAQPRAAPRPTRGSRAADPGHDWPGRHRDDPTSAGPPALRRTTGIVLAVVGAILWLGVHATVAFVATQRAGLVLLVTGLLWLWIPVPDKWDRLRRRFSQLVSFFEWNPASAEGARCSLEDLLEPRSDSAPAGLGE